MRTYMFQSMLFIMVLVFLPANVDAREGSPLHRAAAGGDLAAVKRLIREKHDLDIRDSMQHTPLMLAAMHGHEPVVRLLLRRKATVDLQNYMGETALMLAVQRDQTAVVNTLLKRGASVLQTDHKGWTALMLSRSAEVTALLLRKGAKVNYRIPEHGITALIVAAEEGMLDVVILLLKQGADKELSDAKGRTAMYFALGGGHDVLAELLKAE